MEWALAQPRFLFVARPRSRASNWSPWPGTGAVPVDDTSYTGPWVAWRLLGANNRELGRSGATYPGLVDCVASIDVLKRVISSTAGLVAPEPSTGSWYWRMDADAVAVAVASRAYRRQRECFYSLEQFRAAVPGADIAFRSFAERTETVSVVDRTVRVAPPRLAVDGFTPAPAPRSQVSA